MSHSRRTVLITGCSDGGIGSALAEAFHKRGLQVIATARSVQKMSSLSKLGMTTMSLDVESPQSIAQCVNQVASLTNGKLDILINNAGKGLSKPLVDTSVLEAQELFNTNVFSAHAVTQAFLPLLLKSASMASTSGRPTIVNQTSIVSVIPLPFQGLYNASKAALASLTDTLRLELEPFGIAVVDLKTGAVKSQFFENVRNSNTSDTASDSAVAGSNAQGTNEVNSNTSRRRSIYDPASSVIQEVTSHEELEGAAMPVGKYAEKVVTDLLKNPSKPPVQIWHGTNAGSVRLGRRVLPFTGLDSSMKKLGKMDQVERLIKADTKRV